MSKEVGSLSVEVNITAGDPPQVQCRFKVEGPGVSDQIKAVETAILELFAKSAVEVFTKTSEGETSEKQSGQQSPRQPEGSPNQGQRSPSPYDVFGPQFEQGIKVLEQVLQSDKFRAIRDALKKKQS